MGLVLLPTLLALAAIAAWLAYRQRVYLRGFRRDPRRDEEIIGLPADAYRETVDDVNESCITPHSGIEPGSTVLLRLPLAATWTGWLRDPWLEVLSESGCVRQFFERGAVGRRHVDVSRLFESAAPPLLRVRGHAIQVRGKPSFLAFAPTPATRVLVLAPHPDDAEIAAFGLYSRSESWVCTVTAGERSANFGGGAGGAAAVAAKRIALSLEIPAEGGVPAQRRATLAYPDRALAQMFDAPARDFMLACEAELPRARLRAANPIAEFRDCAPGCNWAGLVAELRTLVAKARPETIVCPHPLLDGHPDHVFTTVALEQALREADGIAPRLLLYVVHVHGASRAPLGPGDSTAGLAPGASIDCVADSIYSHGLDTAAWHAKREVLARMQPGNRDPATRLSRRFARPNEIFYGASPALLTTLVARALERHGARA